MRDLNEAKLRDAARAARRFRRSADAFINAYEALLKHPTGSAGWRKAEERLRAAEVNYDAQALHLDDWTAAYTA